MTEVTNYPETVRDVHDISGVCDAAADVIERDGWTQAELWQGQSVRAPYVQGPVCLLGGIAVVTGLVAALEADHDGEEAYGDLQSSPAVCAVAEHVGWNFGSIYHWNDSNLRTQDEVVQALRDTATKHRDDAMRQPGVQR